jgi:ABC-2 type transport system ATP-binding protein
MRGKEMLKIVNFSKQYGSKIAVSNLNLLVQKGDIMGFIGKNGAGKTTLMRMIADIMTPTNGAVYWRYIC